MIALQAIQLLLLTVLKQLYLKYSTSTAKKDSIFSSLIDNKLLGETIAVHLLYRELFEPLVIDEWTIANTISIHEYNHLIGENIHTGELKSYNRDHPRLPSFFYFGKEFNDPPESQSHKRETFTHQQFQSTHQFSSLTPFNFTEEDRRHSFLQTIMAKDIPSFCEALAQWVELADNHHSQTAGNKSNSIATNASQSFTNFLQELITYSQIELAKVWNNEFPNHAIADTWVTKAYLFSFTLMEKQLQFKQQQSRPLIEIQSSGKCSTLFVFLDNFY